MKRITTLLVMISIFNLVSAQRTTTFQQAFPEEDGRPALLDITDSFIESDLPFIEADLQKTSGERYQQVPGWPKTFEKHPFYYTYRGLALADINNNGIDDIIFVANNKLYAYEGDGNLIWSVTLLGAGTHAPSVADINGDGNPEVVIKVEGYVYAVNNTGQILPGWPYAIPGDRHFGITLADLDNNGQMEIIFSTAQTKKIHVLNANGTPFSGNWPVTLNDLATMGTLSVGDINNDGQMNIIAGDGIGNLYAFDINGAALQGFPVAAPNTNFQFNSPLLADFDQSGQLSIVGSTMGAAHEIYVRNHNGEYRNGWPLPTYPGYPYYNRYWPTYYATPTIADINCDGNPDIVLAGPPVSFVPPISEYTIYGLTAGGELLPNFPITTPWFTGFITVADLDGDGQFELIVGAHGEEGGLGFIHAYKIDGSGELPGFPLRPQGAVVSNGVNLGDVTGDGMLNMVVLTQLTPGFIGGETFINVYNTGIPIADANIQFGTFKGSNTRTGLYEASPFKDAAPGAVTNFNVTPAAQGVLQATITWNNPALQVNGSPLTELNQVKIFRDSVEIATINNPVIGAEQTFIDNTIQENGSHNYRILGINDAGRGVNTFAQCYIGQDVPAAPGNVVLTTDLSDATISWEAPSAGLNGGYFTGENLTYTVIRVPGEFVVAENISLLQVEDNEVAMGRYSYRVTASNNIGEGGSATSNNELLAPDSVLMYEPFDYTLWSLPPGWEFVGAHVLGWEVSPWNEPGCQAPELRFTHYPANIGESRLKTYPVNITGASLLELKLHQSLRNSAANTGEIIGIDITYDDGSTWDVIWEKLIGSTNIPAAEYEFNLSVPEGATSLKLGFRFQGNSLNLVSWNIDNVIITDVSYLREVNFIIVEDSDEELPVAGAKVAIGGNEYFADENGHVLVFLPTGTTTTAVVSAQGYVGQTLDIIVGEENQTIVVKLMDVITAPYDLHVTTEGLEDGQALLGWNGYGPNYEFRHDDGTVTAQLGSTQGTLNTVLGSAYRYDAVLEEMSWFLTNEGGPHNSVKIWVFGLNSSGIPDPSNILFQQVVSNIDMQWNTFQFATPIEASNGFYLGISYAGFAALAMDSGADPQWPFQPNTHFVTNNYINGFAPIEVIGWSKNFLIRAVGTNYGALRLGMNTEPHPVIHDVEFSSVQLDKPFEAGNPQYKGFNRSFAGFNIYLDDFTTPVAENISEIYYLFTGLAGGPHVAGVQSVYTTGSSDIITIEFAMPQTLVPGDANCDGIVNVIDIIAIANYIMSANPEPFCFNNADVNGDGIIDVIDLISTVNIIMGGGSPGLWFQNFH